MVNGRIGANGVNVRHLAVVAEFKFELVSVPPARHASKFYCRIKGDFLHDTFSEGKVLKLENVTMNRAACVTINSW